MDLQEYAVGQTKENKVAFKNCNRYYIRLIIYVFFKISFIIMDMQWLKGYGQGCESWTGVLYIMYLGLWKLYLAHYDAPYLLLQVIKCSFIILACSIKNAN